ncbi:MAG: M23 family metallopeptidase [Ruminococcaceae bacterium]|nr:M23 family metallopeptidase [Oscillospiraceae bacterium]
MEQRYRRRTEHEPTATRRVPRHSSGYKHTLIKQVAICTLLFITLLFAKVTQNPGVKSLRNAIELILNTQTNFSSIPKDMRNLVNTYILRRDAVRSLESKTLLTEMACPIDGIVTSPFGERQHPTNGEEAFHYGIDIGAEPGTKIVCAAEGTVLESGESDDYGYYLLVQHANEIYTLYAHCQELLTSAGQSVEKGQVVATVGATGNATAPHLHFEIRNGESWLDPAEFVTFNQAGDHD